MRCTWADFFLFAALIVIPAVAGAQSPVVPTLEALQAQIDAARGKPPTASYEHLRYTRSGVAGSETVVKSGDDFRDMDRLGQLESANGVYQKQAWHQNENGQTVLEAPDPGRAVADRYTTTLSRVSVPITAYVIARLNSAGSGTKEYVDPATDRIVRSERIEPSEITVTTYDDFRTVAGYTQPWHWTIRDGHSENDADYRIDTFVAREVDPSEVQIVAPRRALVEFPAGKTSVDLPVQLIGNKFVVRVMINGRGLDFILDSGAGGIAINAGVAQQLGLVPVARMSNAVNAGRVSESTLIVPEIGVGELRMHDVVIEAMPWAEDLSDAKVVGLLGFDFIAEMLLRLDYEHGRVTAMTQTDPPMSSQKGTVVLDIRLGSQTPITTVLINGARGERFGVDTGDGVGLIVFDYFARRYPDALVDYGPSPAQNMRLRGVGGSIDVRPYRLHQVTLGNVTFENFIAQRVMERHAYEGDHDGVIGVDELRLYTVWLDYADSRIVMVPNGEGRRAIR